MIALEDPISYESAMVGTESELWKKALAEESAP